MKYLIYMILITLIGCVIWFPVVLFTWDFDEDTNGWWDMKQALELLLNLS